MAANRDDERSSGGNSSSPGPSYTAALAYDPSRLRSRTTAKFCLLNVAPNSAILDKSLGCLSVVTGSALTFVVTFGMVALIPSIAVTTKLLGTTNYFNPVGGDRGDGNVSNFGKGSVTAIKTLGARAQFSEARSGEGGPDELAPVFMRHTSLFGSGVPGSAWFSHFFQLLARWNFYLTGRIFVDQIAEVMGRYLGSPFPIGETALLQVRTCWLDDCVETFVRAHLQGSAGMAEVNVVILGAGYDSRCYRMNLAARGVARYEVDAPGTQAEKLRVLRESRTDAGGTVFVPCDFESEDWLERLRENGFNSGLPTFIVWEGVIMHLDRDVVRAIISKIAELGKGSCIGFDYVDASWALSPTLVKMTKKAGEPWKFGVEAPASDGIKKMVSKCKDKAAAKRRAELSVLDHLRHKELIKRYLPKHYNGRSYGHLGDFGGLILIGSV